MTGNGQSPAGMTHPRFQFDTPPSTLENSARTPQPQQAGTVNNQDHNTTNMTPWTGLREMMAAMVVAQRNASEQQRSIQAHVGLLFDTFQSAATALDNWLNALEAARTGPNTYTQIPQPQTSNSPSLKRGSENISEGTYESEQLPLYSNEGWHQGPQAAETHTYGDPQTYDTGEDPPYSHLVTEQQELMDTDFDTESHDGQHAGGEFDPRYHQQP